MKLIYIYNSNSEIENNLIERVRQELPQYLEEVTFVDFQEVKDIFKIRTTPAIIPIRDDFQGEELLNEVDGQLRVISEIYKIMEEEDKNIHNAETNRIDHLVNAQVEIKMGEVINVMNNMEQLLTELGGI